MHGAGATAYLAGTGYVPGDFGGGGGSNMTAQHANELREMGFQLDSTGGAGGGGGWYGGGAGLESGGGGGSSYTLYGRNIEYSDGVNTGHGKAYVYFVAAGYFYTGDVQGFIVPLNVDSISIAMFGGRGGSSAVASGGQGACRVQSEWCRAPMSAPVTTLPGDSSAASAWSRAEGSVGIGADLTG